MRGTRRPRARPRLGDVRAGGRRGRALGPGRAARPRDPRPARDDRRAGAALRGAPSAGAWWPWPTARGPRRARAQAQGHRARARRHHPAAHAPARHDAQQARRPGPARPGAGSTPWPTACPAGASWVACRGVSLADRLAARTLELVDVPSESRDEAALAAHVLGVLRDGGVAARDAGDTCVLAGATAARRAPARPARRPLRHGPGAGQPPRPARRRRGPRPRRRRHEGRRSRSWSSSRWRARGRRTIDLGFVFFGREELPVTESALGRAARARAGAARRRPRASSWSPPPTPIHAGCLGNVNATLDVPRALSGHSARPWLADNAIHRAAAGIDALAQVAARAARVRRAALHRGRLGHAGRRRDRRQRRPRPRPSRTSTTATRPGRSADGGRGAGCASCASRTATLTIDGNAPSARPVAIANPMAQRLIAAGDLRGRAQAGVDARSPSSPPPASTPSTSAPATRPRRTPATSTSRVDALVRCYETLEAFACALNPVLAGMTTYPFLRLTRPSAPALARGVDVIDFGVGEPREVTPAFIRARARPRRSRPSRSRPTRRPRACPSCARRSPAGSQRRFGAALDPDTEVVPTLGSKEAIFHLAQVVGRPRRPRRGHDARLPGGRRAARCSPAREVRRAAARPRARLAARPRRGRLGRRRAAVAELPRTTRRRRRRRSSSTSAPPRWRARTTSSSPATRPTPSCGSRATRRSARCRSPTARTSLVFNTLSKRSSMPGYRSGFAAGDPELVAALKRYRPNVGVAPQTFVQRAAVAAWGDEDHVVEVRERYRAKRDALLPALLAAGLSPPAATRRSSSGCACRTARTPRRSRCACSRARHRRRPGPVLRPRRRGPRARRARADARRLPPRRRAPRIRLA